MLKKGFNFQSNCDREIITNLYQIYLVDFVKKLDGMFTLAHRINLKIIFFNKRLL